MFINIKKNILLEKEAKYFVKLFIFAGKYIQVKNLSQ